MEFLSEGPVFGMRSWQDHLVCFVRERVHTFEF
jgi:hypothetical protein